jgi:hypothetical protein
MRIQLEVLKDHADTRSQSMDVRFGRLHRHAFHKDLSFLKMLQSIDAPQQGAFPRSARSANDDLFPPFNGFGNPAQGLMTLSVPQAHVSDLDHDEGSNAMRLSIRRLAAVPIEQSTK